MNVRSVSAKAAMSAAIVAAAVSSSSCGTMTEAWQLTDFRILGVRAYPAMEPARNAPRRGETAVLELKTVDVRERLVRVAWLIVDSAAFTTGAPTGGGDGGAPMGGLRLPPNLALCDSPDFALDLPGIALRCGERAEFVVPSTGGPDARGRESLTIFGMACAAGRIRVRTTNPDGGASGNTGALPFECASESGMQRGWPFQYTMLVGSAAGGTGNDNMHPRITGVRAGLRGGTLSPVSIESPATIARCADQSRNTQCPRLRIEVDFDEASRERYPEIDPNTRMTVMRDERLVTGFIVDRGKLSGGFRTDSEADPRSIMGNDFLPPAEPGDVRVLLYATDGRGGFDAREVRVRVE
jgi:hypothetical protein